MNALTIALILVALGSAGLALRGNRLVLAAGGIQWLGLAVAGQATAPNGALSLGRAGIVEFVTGFVCIAVLAITLRALPAPRQDGASLRDNAMTVLVVVAGAAAGLVLSALYPLTGLWQQDLIFYWAALSGGIALSFEGTRNPVRLSMGLFALLNATMLLMLILSISPLSPLVTALVALSRLALALMLAYGWSWLTETYGSLSLEPLFGRPPETASRELMPLPTMDDDGDIPIPVLVGPLPEAAATQAEGRDTE